MWKFSGRLLHFCTSERSKDQPPLSLKKADGQAYRNAEMQKSARQFPHSLDLSLQTSTILPLNVQIETTFLTFWNLFR